MAVSESSNNGERKDSEKMTAVIEEVTMAVAPVEHKTLAHALAAFQAERPRVVKDSTNPHLGNMYAGLDAFESAILPVLAKHGLAWTCMPTMLTEDRSFMLVYELIHAESGSKINGVYPLTEGSSQVMGSAITYAKRYCLSAVTGVSADEDDDGHAASNAPAQRPAQQRPPQQRPQQGSRERPAQGQQAAQEQNPEPAAKPEGQASAQQGATNWEAMLDQASKTDSLTELRSIWKSWGVENAPKSVQDRFASRVESVRRADQAIADALDAAAARTAGDA